MEYSMCELAYRSVHRVEGVVKNTHTHKPLCGYQRRAQVVRNHQLFSRSHCPRPLFCVCSLARRVADCWLLDWPPRSALLWVSGCPCILRRWHCFWTSTSLSTLTSARGGLPILFYWPVLCDRVGSWSIIWPSQRNFAYLALFGTFGYWLLVILVLPYPLPAG